MKFVLTNTYTLYTTHLESSCLGIKTSLLSNLTFQREVLYVLVIGNYPIFYLAVRVMTQLLIQTGKLCPINSHFVFLAPDCQTIWLMFLNPPSGLIEIICCVDSIYTAPRGEKVEFYLYYNLYANVFVSGISLLFKKSHIFIS